MWKIIKILFHLSTLGIPWALWWFLKAVFTTPYIDKLKLIPGVGEKTADKLAAEFPDEESIKNASIEQIASIHGVSIEMANDIKTYGKF